MWHGCCGIAVHRSGRRRRGDHAPGVSAGTKPAAPAATRAMPNTMPATCTPRGACRPSVAPLARRSQVGGAPDRPMAMPRDDRESMKSTLIDRVASGATPKSLPSGFEARRMNPAMPQREQDEAEQRERLPSCGMLLGDNGRGSCFGPPTRDGGSAYAAPARGQSRHERHVLQRIDRLEWLDDRRMHPMTEKYRSFTITKGVARSPNRSMLRAIGYQRRRFRQAHRRHRQRPLDDEPCNAGIQPLADARRRGRADAPARCRRCSAPSP